MAYHHYPFAPEEKEARISLSYCVNCCRKDVYVLKGSKKEKIDLLFSHRKGFTTNPISCFNGCSLGSNFLKSKTNKQSNIKEVDKDINSGKYFNNCIMITQCRDKSTKKENGYHEQRKTKM